MIPSSWDGPLPDPDIRTIWDMSLVLAEPMPGPDRPLYYMYRGCSQNALDHALIAAVGLRFDITVIPAGNLGREFIKTKGHFHVPFPDGNSYPELYGVMQGEAWFLLQDRHLRDAVVIKAKQGDLVLIPPGYGHVTINPGSSDLEMANFISVHCLSEYALYEMFRGAVYYACTDGTFRKNPLWRQEVTLREVTPRQYPSFGITSGTDIYSFTRKTEALRFLNHPEYYPECMVPP